MDVRFRRSVLTLAVASFLVGCTSVAVAPPPPPPVPPAPPPPPIVRSDTGVMSDEITVTGTRRERTDDGMAAPAPVMAEGEASGASASTPDGTIIMPEPEPRIDQPEPQAGMLTAGDYDDVLNPELYKSYLDKLLQGELQYKDLPYVDADQRIAIRVVDRLGKPVPLAKVSLRTASGEPMFPLRTGANGVAYLYPNYDALDAGMTVTVAASGTQALTQTLSANRLTEGGELTFDLSKDAAKVQKLDLLLTLDATGSMSDEMRYLQVELVGILDRLKRAHPGLDIHAGFVVYRDRGDDYVVKSAPFTDDLSTFKAQLSEQEAQGGGDFPEAMQDALKAGLDFAWRDDAIKVNLLVADAPPHDGDIAATWDSALISRSRGIHMVPLAASGVEKTAEFLMRGMAQMTGGRYMFLTDDSGIGNPHAEPTVDCYVVTRLDGLVLRVLENLITGVRVEPDGEGVIRTVGNYRAGICKLDQEQVG